MFDLFSLNLILVIGLAAFAFITYRRLDLGLYITIFSLPLYLIRLKIFGIPTTVLELMIYILFLVFVIRSFLLPKILPERVRSPSRRLLRFFDSQSLSRRMKGFAQRLSENFYFVIASDRRERSNPVFKPKMRLLRRLRLLAMTVVGQPHHNWTNRDFILLFTGIVLLFSGTMISTLLSSDKIVSGGILKGWFFDPLLLFLILIATIKTSQQVKNIFYALSISGFAVAIISLGYWFLGELTYDGRLRAFWLSPNHLAMFLAPSLIISYGLQVASKMLKEKIFWLVVFLIILLPFYLTYSYGAWLGIAAALFFFVFKIQGANLLFKRKLAPSFIIILLLITTIVYFQISTEKFQNLLAFSRSSFESRLMIWQAALEMIKDYPLQGIGPGMFQKYYLDYQWQFPSYLEWAVPQPHNIFLAFWLQSGILGLAGFILILIWFFKIGRKVLKKINAQRLEFKNYLNNYFLSTTCISIMVYTLVPGLIDTPYWKNDLAAIFWIIIGLMAIISKEKIEYWSI